jgi:CHAD domain-containing protein
MGGPIFHNRTDLGIQSVAKEAGMADPSLIESSTQADGDAAMMSLQQAAVSPQQGKKAPVGAIRAGITPAEPMAEAVRKILRSQFQVMAASEAGSRKGKNIEAVHDMRVATRRMRAAFRLFGMYFEAKATRDFRAGLRQTGRVLGAVRDLDVFNREAQIYLDTLPDDRRDGLGPLFEQWERERKQARKALIVFLDGKRYRRFAGQFSTFLDTEGAGVAHAPAGTVGRREVRHVLNGTVWQLYETVRAYETVIPGAPAAVHHALRIDCKFLRYALEFFEEVLGPGTAELIVEVIAIQNHLGDLQDAEVASRLIADFLAEWYDGAMTDPTVDVGAVDGVVEYLNYRRGEARQLIATFAEVWPRINSPEFRMRLSEALLVL